LVQPVEGHIEPFHGEACGGLLEVALGGAIPPRATSSHIDEDGRGVSWRAPS
jgi:hypothetical protein